MKSKSILALIITSVMLPLRLTAQKQQPQACTVKAGDYFGWKAQRVSNRWVTLTFLPQLGGRLMQLEFAGHSYLFVNPKYRGKYIPPEEAHGKWINYGGDKIWPMPEGENDENHWVLQSSALDDGIANFEILSQGKECSVRLTGQPDVNTGMRIIRTITLGASTPEVHFHAVMENIASHPITWSIQSVSQYDLVSHDKPGDFNHDLWAFTPRNLSSNFPDGFHVRYGLAQDPAFSIDDDLFRLHWTRFANEVWLDSQAGWLAVVDKSSSYGMVETFHVDPKAEYPGKTTVIFYKNGPTVNFDSTGATSISSTDTAETPYYMEAEINSPMATLQPGETFAFDTTWHPVSLSQQPRNVATAGVIAAPLTLVREGGTVRLKGKLSVFAPGQLVAVVFNRGGVRIAEHRLNDVDPSKAVTLDTPIPLDEHASRISIALKGEQGQDLGILSTALLAKEEPTPP